MSNQFRTKAELKRSYCDQCDKSFSRPDTLTLHKKRAHLKAEPRQRHLPFACPECGKVYGESAIFSRHMQMVHDRTHFFDCVACDGSFRYIKSLKAHYHYVHEQGRNSSKRLPRKRASTSRRSGSSSKQRKSSASAAAEQSRRNEPSPSSSEDESTELDDDQWYTALKLEHSGKTSTATATPAAAKHQASKNKTPTEDETAASGARAGLFSVLEQRFERDDGSGASQDSAELETPPGSGSGHEDEDEQSADKHGEDPDAAGGGAGGADAGAASLGGTAAAFAEDFGSVGDGDGEVNVVIAYESVACCSPGPPDDADASATPACERDGDDARHDAHNGTRLPTPAGSACSDVDMEQASDTLCSDSRAARPTEIPATPNPPPDASSPAELDERKRAQLLLPSPIRFCKLLDEQ